MSTPPPMQSPALAPLSPLNAPASGFGGNPWGTPPASSPYGSDAYEPDYQLQAAPPTPVSNYPPPQFSQMPMNTSGYSSTQYKRQSRGFSSTALGGMAMMALAVVWFFGGLAVGVIFIYPPIMFVIGFCSMIGGLFGGGGDD
ncbi:hypothetical protein [Anatilimnocola aggregata]|uniref:hypothetical protein n=1 Tax=Anatilimnocola aggregata TaxID=2528021 RepID=UPI0011A4E313|nr:hypothetical protein [Anatilimnocola aggregata]